MAGRTAGRLGAALCIAASVGSVLGSVASGASLDRAGAYAAPLAALVLAGLLWTLPWHRWPARALLVPVAAAIGVLAAGNYVDPDPYVAGLYFVVLALWVGLVQRPGTVVALAPLIAVAYWAPLAARSPGPTLDGSVVSLVAVAVLVGETVALVGRRVRRSHDGLQASQERRFETLVGASSDVTAVFDATGRMTYCSHPLGRWLGRDALTPPELPSLRELAHAVHPDDLPGLRRRVGALLRTAGDHARAELRLAGPDGSWRDVEVILRNLLLEPQVAGFLLTVRDVSDRRELERGLARQAFHDPLTGLANRTLLRERLAAAGARPGRHAVVFLDLDDFKTVNDSLGHTVGDELLTVVAGRLTAVVGPADTVARVGGDEFTVLLASVEDEAAAVDVAERIVAAVARPVTVDGRALVVMASAGVAVGGAEDGPDAGMHGADLAMYAAKRSGVGRVRLYDPRMHAEVLERVDLRARLRTAADEDAFELHYQPIVALADGRVMGVEALLRWHHPERGLLGPGAFIDQAEETGLIVPIGRMVLYRSCEEVRRLQLSHSAHGRLRVGVNVSPAQFSSETLTADVQGALASSGLDPACLVLEVTENVLLASSGEAMERLVALKALGVRIAVDDFGTGYSSLSYLVDYPFDVVKIDQRFVRDLGRDPVSREVTRAVVALGAALGLDMVAEGIEGTDQAQLLIALGARIGQGFGFCPPLPLAQLQRWLADADGRVDLPLAA